MKRCRAAGSTVFVACALLARVGHTQDVGQAEVLFEQGSQLVNAGQYERACPKLEAAQALVTGISVTCCSAVLRTDGTPDTGVGRVQRGSSSR